MKTERVISGIYSTFALIRGDNLSHSSRVYEIIKILLSKTDYITVSEIAETLKISKRTIFRELEDVEKTLLDNDIRLIKKTRSGIKIEAEQRTIDGFLNSNQIWDVIYSPEERQNLLIIELLKSKEPKKLYFFSKLLNVSEATISNDMDKIDEWFKKRQLELIRKPGLGVYLNGKEKSFRKGITDYLYQNYDHQELLELTTKEEIDVENLLYEVDKRLLSLISKDILLKVSHLLKHFEPKLSKKLTESAYIGLVIHLTIAVQRVLNGESIFMNGEILTSIQEDDNYVLASNISKGLEEVFEIQIPKDEVGYITMHLKGSKLKASAMIEGNDFIVSNFELSRLVSKMIHEFKNQSGHNLNDDEKLLYGLVSHLRPALTRMKLDLKIRNPLLDKIIEMYPTIFSISREVSQIISSKFEVHVPEEEIGFITMHFGSALERLKRATEEVKRVKVGVVCSSGVGTSSILSSRIMKLFPEIDIVGQYAKEEIMNGEVRDDELSLLISTIELDTKEYPYIVVSPLLFESDQEKVRNILKMMNREMVEVKENPMNRKVNNTYKVEKIYETTQGIMELKNNLRVIHIQENITMKNLIEYVSKAFVAPKGNSKKLKEELKSREELGSTVLKEERIMLLHTKTNEVTELQFSIIRLQEELEVLNYKTKFHVNLIIVMIIPENSTKDKLNLMSLMSRNLIENQAFLTALNEESKEKIELMMMELLNDWLGKIISVN